MGIRGIKSPEEVAEEQRARRKDELLAQAREKTNLSWVVQLDGAGKGKVRYAASVYRLEEQKNGSLWIVDADIDVPVRIFAAGAWFGVTMEHQPHIGSNNIIWSRFKPHAAYLADLAERLVGDQIERPHS